MHSEFILKEYADIICEVLESGGVFRMYPKGTSMLPLLRYQKDSVVLALPQMPLKKGEIILYKRGNGQYVLHRIVGKDQEGYICCGDNQTTLEYGITEENVIAVVESIYRKEKHITKNNFGYRCYWFFWQCLFIRRVVWKLGKILPVKNKMR